MNVSRIIRISCTNVCHLTAKNSKKLMEKNSVRWIRCNAKRNFSSETTATETKVAEKISVAEPVKKSSGVGKKIAFFTAFVAAGGLGTFAYMISVDEEFLFQARDSAPALVNFVAPYVGLPVDEDTGEFDEEEFGIRDVSEIVGDELLVLATLKSGRVVRVLAPSDSTQAFIEEKVIEKSGLANPEIIDLRFADQGEIEELNSKNDEEINDTFGEIQIPEIKENSTKEDLQFTLAACRVQEFDLKVQETLAIKYGTDTTKMKRALLEIEERKKQVKLMIRAM